MTRVYFILNPDNGLVKIGYSNHIQQRLKTLSTLSGSDLTILKLTPGGKKKERELHKRLSHLRVEGEYFTDCDELRSVIEELR